MKYNNLVKLWNFDKYKMWKSVKHELLLENVESLLWKEYL